MERVGFFGDIALYVHVSTIARSRGGKNTVAAYRAHAAEALKKALARIQRIIRGQSVGRCGVEQTFIKQIDGVCARRALDKLLGNLKIEQLWMALDLILAAVLGFFIGLERKLRDKEAGIRTHTIVSFGAALMMVISKFAFDSEADTSRVAAQIVAGIGFLGAGIIVYKKNVVHGLTTAAGVWTTAGVGMACGGGLWLIAILATGILILIQFCLHRKIFRHKKLYSIKIVFVQGTNEREQVKALFDIDRYNRLVVERDGDELIYQAILDTDIEYSSAQLDEIMKAHKFIRSIERMDDN